MMSKEAGFDAAVAALRAWSKNRLSDETNNFLRIAADDLEANRDAILAAHQTTPERPPAETSKTPTPPAWPANTQEQSYRAQSPAQAIQGHPVLPDRSAS